MAAGGVNPNLPGASAIEALTTSEKNWALLDAAMPFCFDFCVHHWSEETLPYASGEKTCLDRCVMKLWQASDMSKQKHAEVEEAKKRGMDGMPWMAALVEHHKALGK